ncbi:cyclase family protein [Halosimplex carlsbadense 2-9-1]|uniref:Cyclase family protein n=1 Tax=Halosimplex carlsbadense 2-9-1 TaxID=797114 RepID=M0CK46_9EURY|nr:cyclase family protein [Halosimplex carlsbadense]ELZ23606.1 cyclase family protein [Halosimplex carlsbadense 2-9-1]
MSSFDLSHRLATGMPVYPGTEPVSVEPSATRASDGYRTTRLDLDSHAGTHVDAPAHLTAGPSLDEFPVDRFRFDAVAADLRPLEARDPIDLDALRAALAVDPDQVDLVAVVTGWDRHWGDDRYLDHPYLTAEAAAWLAERDCDLGVDTINPDPTPTERAGEGEPDGFPVHERLFGADRLIVENLRGLDRLPERFELRAYPLRFESADASPVRAVAYAGDGESR